MLLTAIVVSAMVIAATSLASLLTLYELRQVTDVKNSGAAIFAADAGSECLSYQLAFNTNYDCNNGTLTNGASYVTTSTASSPGIYTSLGRFRSDQPGLADKLQRVRLAAHRPHDDKGSQRAHRPS